MHAEFSYRLHTFWVVIYCRYSTLYWEITEFMKSAARKKVALFVNRPMALQCMTLKYRHKDSMHTMERLVAPLNKSATVFPSTLLNKIDVLIMKIMINSTEWPLKMCVRKFCMHSILNEQIWLNISQVTCISKSVRWEPTFLVECILGCGLWRMQVKAIAVIGLGGHIFVKSATILYKQSICPIQITECTFSFLLE